MEAIGVDPSMSRSIDTLVLQGAEGDGVEVIAQAESKKLAEVDAAKQDLDCNASSCLAELAGAMGAQIVLFGSVSQLGETVTVSLSLFDQKTGQIVRDNVTTKNVGSLPLDLPPRVRALV